jgi:hypothetical protein
MSETNQIQFDFTKNFTKKKLIEFADILVAMRQKIGFKVSSRGWCYLMEQAGYINKNQFNKVDDAINRARKEGFLPVDFVAEEKARMFSGIEIPNIYTDKPEVRNVLEWMLRDVIDGDKYYTPNWWDGEEYYIQLLVEKVDLVELFAPICQQYHIPIANARGWSSILQRAAYARRFKEAEDRGLQCVLLYCGDHDPDGLRISDTIMKNLEDLNRVMWSDGEAGYDPQNLTIHRFGLNYDFIIANKLTWIDNLITGNTTKVMDLGDKSHKNHGLPYVQNYLRSVGRRKCEANAIVTSPESARQLITDEITNWLGTGARDRFAAKRAEIRKEYFNELEATGLKAPILKFLGRDDEPTGGDKNYDADDEI